MNALQQFTDKIAISLSMMCLVHCLALPLLFVVWPSLLALGLGDEVFHVWMIVLAIPTSAYALTMGCKQHKRFQLLALGALGLVLLVAAVSIPESIIGYDGETVLTVLGACLIASGHLFNYRLCRRHAKAHQPDCACS